MLDNVYLSLGKLDSRVWKPDTKGHFLVKSFFSVLNDSSVREDGWSSFWDPSVPPRVLVFCWIVRKYKILTIDKWRRRNHIVVNGCPLCLNDEESVHHLMIHCVFASKLESVECHP